MPCNDGPQYGGRSYETPKSNGMTMSQFEAVLCGVFDAVESEALPVADLLDWVDWKEVGVTRSLVEKWHVKHKKQDEARRLREQVKRKREALRKSALSKLTNAEREALKLD